MKRLFLFFIMAIIGFSAFTQTEIYQMPNGERFLVEVHQIDITPDYKEQALNISANVWYNLEKNYYKKSEMNVRERWLFFQILNSYGIQEGQGGGIWFTWEAMQYPFNKETICAWIIRNRKNECIGRAYRRK